MKSRELLTMNAAIRSLARIAVLNGCGIAAVETALRKAFVMAAGERCKLANGKPNHAQINAATGLPRSAIRGLLRGDISRMIDTSLVNTTPAARILSRLNGSAPRPSPGVSEDALIRRLQRSIAPDSTPQALVKEIAHLRKTNRRGSGKR